MTSWCLVSSIFRAVFQTGCSLFCIHTELRDCFFCQSWHLNLGHCITSEAIAQCVSRQLSSFKCVCVLGAVADNLRCCSSEAAHLVFCDRYFHRPCYQQTFPPAGDNVCDVWMYTEDGGCLEDLSVAVLLSYYKGIKYYTSVAHIL